MNTNLETQWAATLNIDECNLESWSTFYPIITTFNPSITTILNLDEPKWRLDLTSTLTQQPWWSQIRWTHLAIATSLSLLSSHELKLIPNMIIRSLESTTLMPTPSNWKPRIHGCACNLNTRKCNKVIITTHPHLRTEVEALNLSQSNCKVSNTWETNLNPQSGNYVIATTHPHLGS